MSVGNSLDYIVTAIYFGGGSLVRYLYIRSSLQSNLQEVYKRDKFILLCFLIPKVTKGMMKHFLKFENISFFSVFMWLMLWCL